jgi:hypothetical protein
MNPMTCEQVQEQLDLLAAGACDQPTAAAVEEHLRGCPTCAAACATSRRLVGLLDLRWNEKRTAQLRRRIDNEARRARRLLTPLTRRALAAAAMFLLAVGLLWQLPHNQQTIEPRFALLVQAPMRAAHPSADKGTAERAAGAESVAVIALGPRRGEALRRDLLQAQRQGKLPPPPAVALELVLVNSGNRPVEMRLGDAAPTLSLAIKGDGVVRMPAPDAATPRFLQRQTLHLGPGERHVVSIDRLIAGSRDKLEYVYLTEPGDHMLTAQLRFTADGRLVTVTGTPVRIKIGD